jgi:hypothetical protein
MIMLLTGFCNAKSERINYCNSNNTSTACTQINDDPIKGLALLSKMRFTQIETYIGRKLKFKEKLAIWVLKYKFKHGLKSNDDPTYKKGKNALTLGVLALVTLFLFPLATIPLGILAITNGNAAKKINPNDRNAKAAIVLGRVSLTIFVLEVIVLIAVLTLWPIL